MGKNIIICCDGTSLDIGDRRSNVVKLYAVLQRVPDQQIVYYDPGVGTPSTYNSFIPITKKLKNILGLSFGYGLSDNIVDAYRFLMQCYEEGDQLYFFGFSRGAYTVRALAGLIDTCGLLHANSQNLIPEAMRIYSDRSKKDIAVIFKQTFSRPCTVHFLGLWDTVSSVGWVYNPVTLQATSTNQSVKYVRHAISIDERRAFFRQNLWGRLKPEDDQIRQDVKQVWFAGEHSDIGGSYPQEESALSNIALEWMLTEARDKGMLIDEAKAREAVTIKIKDKVIDHPHLQPQHESLTGFWYVAEIWLKIVRVNKGKDANGKSIWVSRPYFNLGRHRFMSRTYKNTLHESVLLRLQGREDYRPKNLMGICNDINAIPEHFQIEKWVRLV